MWLLKLHIEISFLLFWCVIGLGVLFRKELKRKVKIWNEGKEHSKHGRILKYFMGVVKLFFICICPLLNLGAVGVLFLIVFGSDEFMKALKSLNKKGE